MDLFISFKDSANFSLIARTSNQETAIPRNDDEMCSYSVELIAKLLPVSGKVMFLIDKGVL